MHRRRSFCHLLPSFYFRYNLRPTQDQTETCTTTPRYALPKPPPPPRRRAGTLAPHRARSGVRQSPAPRGPQASEQLCDGLSDCAYCVPPSSPCLLSLHIRPSGRGRPKFGFHKQTELPGLTPSSTHPPSSSATLSWWTPARSPASAGSPAAGPSPRSRCCWEQTSSVC